MITIIKNIEVYAPEALGTLDVLLMGGKIAKMGSQIEMNSEQVPIEVIEGKGKCLLPGLIDNHVHFLGGGGEGGFKTRTPEVVLSDFIKGGITTAVGCLGTDSVTRHMTSLVAKTYALREEGISAYAMVGAYPIPTPTITGDVKTDMLMIEPIIGVGEIALSDHRSAEPTQEDFFKLVAMARVGGILSGKAGLVNVHIGDGARGLTYLRSMQTVSDLPLTQVLPTHVNRNENLLNEGIAYAKQGGFIDFTASMSSDEDERSAEKAIVKALSEGVPIDHITVSSDGQGSLPRFDKQGMFLGMGIGRVTALYASLKALHQVHHLPLDMALKPYTLNPANRLNLVKKGRIEEGCDADLLMIDHKTFELDSVYARDKWLMKDKVLMVKGTYE